MKICNATEGMYLSDVDGNIPSGMKWCPNCDRVWTRFFGQMCDTCLGKPGDEKLRLLRVEIHEHFQAIRFALRQGTLVDRRERLHAFNLVSADEDAALKQCGTVEFEKIKARWMQKTEREYRQIVLDHKYNLPTAKEGEEATKLVRGME